MKIAIQSFHYNTSPHDNIPTVKVCLQIAAQLKKNQLDNKTHKDRHTASTFHFIMVKKKGVTAGEVEHEEKNLENVLINGRQTMRKINQCFQCLVSSSGKRRKTDNNKKKKEAEKRTDEKTATKLGQRNFLNSVELAIFFLTL